ncbi:MAG: S8 family serine peptidase [Muribaculaceae bacterium]|nr:S8 family serine peptidase [Muribaculaceae bacterium]
MKTFSSVILMTAITAAGSLTCQAARHTLSTKFDGPSRQHILFEQRGHARSATLLSGFIAFAPGYEAELPAGTYSEFYRVNDGIAIVRGSLEQFESIAALPQVSAIRLSRIGTVTNDISARLTGAAAVNTAPGIEGKTYTGKGVIAGIFDNGFDFRNPSFRRDDGHSRVLRYFNIGDETTEYSQQALIDALTTDNSEEMHGSHVLGTMAGYYPGGQYNGMATEADIVVGSGVLLDDIIAQGVARIATFAREQGKPCVINLSISDFLGPHDGTDLFARSLQAATYDSGDAILCIAAGNDAETGHSVSTTFTDGQTEARTLIYYWDPEKLFEGGVAVWSGDSRDISLSLALYDKTTAEPLVSFPIETNPDATFLINSYDYSEEIPDELEAISHEVFDKAFTNSTLSAHFDTNSATNGRPSFHIYYSLHINRETGGTIVPGIIVRGKAGQRVDINMAGENCIMRGLAGEGWYNGNQDMSISSMACTRGAVSTGAYVTRPTFDNIDGKAISAGDFEEGQYAPWSSLGTTVDGRQLPFTAAP